MRNNLFLLLQTTVLAFLTCWLFLNNHPVAACFAMAFLFLTLSTRGDS
jgi:hypothetical protein